MKKWKKERIRHIVNDLQCLQERLQTVEMNINVIEKKSINKCVCELEVLMDELMGIIKGEKDET